MVDRLKATLALEEPVESVRSVSAKRAQALAALSIYTVRDLLNHFPRRYMDLSSVQTVASAQIGQSCTILGTVYEVKLKKPRPRLSLVEVSIVDNTGVLIVTFFQQPWLARSLEAGQQLAVAGKVDFNYGFKRMTNPLMEPVDSQKLTGTIIPVHKASSKVSAAQMRNIIEAALELTAGLLDPLPAELRQKYRLMSRQEALRAIHFPKTMEEVRQAKRRLAYEEVLLLELFLMHQARRKTDGLEPTQHKIEGERIDQLTASIPFDLTEDQAKAVQEILASMAAPQLMNHMLLGDVGTGKTIVAAYAVAAAVQSDKQALFMVPTEVLAEQHFNTLAPLLEQAGIRAALLTGSTTSQDRQNILASLADGTLDLLIGTHALLEPDVLPASAGLIIIDEQQRFGVDQRGSLLEKAPAADALYLTATPIPRTLALTLFGGLSLSYLHQKPHKEATRSTFVLQKNDQGRAFDRALEALSRGEQVFIVCPLIGEPSSAGRDNDEPDEESFLSISIDDESDFEGSDLRAVVKEAEILGATTFIDYNVDVLHGGLPSGQKQDVMERFSSGDIDVLVATTVIEVGIDVPNATVMIIQDADRFGLSQLHQLRGRVGRGTKSAQVFLISSSKNPKAIQRLAAMESTEDGFELATYDLSLRREGDLLGNRQHGAGQLKLVQVMRDGKLIEAAHGDAAELLEYDQDLDDPSHLALRRELRTIFGATEVQGG